MGVYDEKRTVWVDPINGVSVAYVFGTNVDAADSTALGHGTIATLAKPGVAGASAPKPARLSLKRATGAVSSFVDWNSYEAAIDAGWKVAKGAKLPPQPGSTGKSVVMSVALAPNVRAAWNMRGTQIAEIGAANLASMGIEPLTATESKDAVRGGNRWYGVPIVGASSKLVDKTLSVKYVDPSVVDSLPAGWTATSNSGLSDPTAAI